MQRCRNKADGLTPQPVGEKANITDMIIYKN